MPGLEKNRFGEKGKDSNSSCFETEENMDRRKCHSCGVGRRECE